MVVYSLMQEVFQMVLPSFLSLSNLTMLATLSLVLLLWFGYREKSVRAFSLYQKRLLQNLRV